MNPASNQPATTAPVQGSGEADDTRRCAGAWFSPRSVFIAALLLALGYALATDRVWEDYYITWKSSKNLAEGNGLVFHPGERVHTFTSPLGVLLPAL